MKSKFYKLFKLKKFIKKNNLIFISCNLKLIKNIKQNLILYKIKNSLAIFFISNSIFKNLTVAINGTTTLIQLKNKNSIINLSNLYKFNLLGFIFNNNIYYYKENIKILTYKLIFFKIYKFFLKITKKICILFNKIK